MVLKSKLFLRIAKAGLFALILVLAFIFITNIWVNYSTNDAIYSVQSIDRNNVALVFGTSKRTVGGGENRFFKERMATAASLFEAGKVRHILVSGDNSSQYYNEPRDMLKALGELNVPDSAITLDFAGFRTLDSVVRSKEVFGQDSIILITQKFHCYRALFIANHYGMHAKAVSSDDGGAIGNMLAVREVMARMVAVLDLYVFQRKPKFLGDEERLDVG